MPFSSQVSVQVSTRPGTVEVSASNGEAVDVHFGMAEAKR